VPGTWHVNIPSYLVSPQSLSADLAAQLILIGTSDIPRMRQAMLFVVVVIDCPHIAFDCTCLDKNRLKSGTSQKVIYIPQHYIINCDNIVSSRALGLSSLTVNGSGKPFPAERPNHCKKGI
jgi:hypothetical protein